MLPSGDMDGPNWTDWRWQLQNRITGAGQLRRFLPALPPEVERQLEAHGERFRLAITPYLLALSGAGVALMIGLWTIPLPAPCPVHRLAVPHGRAARERLGRTGAPAGANPT